MGVWETLSLLQQHWCQTHNGAHQNPTSEEQTPPTSSLDLQMETAAGTRAAAAQHVPFALRHNSVRLTEGVLLTGGSPNTD